MAEPASNRRTPEPLTLERQLWATADALRGHMDAADYKQVVLGLIFLKYISDAFEKCRLKLLAEVADGADPEDPEEYAAERVFWVPVEARWSTVAAKALSPEIGEVLDDAMTAIERDNPSLKDVLPKGYSRSTIVKTQLGQLITGLTNFDTADARAKDADILGTTYQYFLSQFAGAEGKKGGEFYTPQPVVQVLVEMLAPYQGRIYDPCCGSGGMFVQSERFVAEHHGRIADVSIFGQESNPNTWKLAKMNLAIRGIEADLGPENADTFHRDLHADRRFDYILANPPFNVSSWGGDRLKSDVRWAHGTPPATNANYAWVQHILHHLAPNGVAGFVLANGSLSTNTGGEGAIRAAIVDADLVDCIVSLPGQLFYSTQIPVSLWFLARNKRNGRGLEGKPLKDRSGAVLFIDARELGHMDTRVHKTLSDADIARIADTYHAWRGDGETQYADVPGFCRLATLAEIAAHGHVLTPGRYVGAKPADADTEPFMDKMSRLTAQLETQFTESARLETQIRANLASLGLTSQG